MRSVGLPTWHLGLAPYFVYCITDLPGRRLPARSVRNMAILLAVVLGHDLDDNDRNFKYC